MYSWATKVRDSPLWSTTRCWPRQAYPTYALSREEWKALQKRHKIAVVPSQDPDAIGIEVWWYPPRRFAADGFVDRLSLFLSLKADHDERTEAALEEMMERFEW